MRIHIAAAVVFSLALSPQPRGWVSSVTGTADPSGTIQFLVRGTNPCGAVNLNYGDGTDATHAIREVPVTIPHEYTRTGEYFVHAKGMSNCDGEVTTRVHVARVRLQIQGPPTLAEAIRFAEMDENGDGVIMRAEWRGTQQSFDEHDWNGDRRLAGDEVRIGARRPSDWTDDQFRLLDRNRDNFVSRGEWPSERDEFVRVDLNRDDRLSLNEFQQGAPTPAIRFAEMDENGDGVIMRAEWRGNLQSFDEHDWNGDRRLAGDEVRIGARRPNDWTDDQFRLLDRNRDNFVSRGEWPAELNDFVRVDSNRDDRLSLDEFLNGDSVNNAARGNAGRGRGRGARGRDASVTTMVSSREEWTDTGLDVNAGDVLTVDATGTIQYSAQSPVIGPNGAPGRRATNSAPLPDVVIGALLARVGNSAPFLVGARSDGLRSSQAGRLYLGVNDDILTDNRGEFRVTVSVTRGAAYLGATLTLNRAGGLSAEARTRMP